MRALCRARHTEYVQEPFGVVLLALLHVIFFDLFCLESCHLRQRTGDEVRHRIILLTVGGVPVYLL